MVRSNAYTRLMRKEARLKAIPPVNPLFHSTMVRSGYGLRPVRHAGQIERLGGKRMDLEVSVEPCIPPVNTVPHNGQIEAWFKARRACWSNRTLARKEEGLKAQGGTLYFNCQHCIACC